MQLSGCDVFVAQNGCGENVWDMTELVIVKENQSFFTIVIVLLGCGNFGIDLPLALNRRTLLMGKKL